jgi:threonine aldolase
VLCGKTEFIEKARTWRKRLGGGMRQSGVLAAAGLVGVNTMVERLAEDHDNAKALAAGLQGTKFRCDAPETNIVIVDVRETGVDPAAILAGLEKHGIRAVQADAARIRLVTHCDVNRAAVESAIATFRSFRP